MNSCVELTTKARTLEQLRGKLVMSSILPVYIINLLGFSERRDSIYEEICRFFKEDKLVVRSSFSDEDTSFQSNAGRYLSVLDVCKNDKASVLQAIESVFASYGKCRDREEILIQPMLMDIDIIGVLFSKDINSGAPYYTINYHEGNKPSAITAGSVENHSTYIHYRNSPIRPKRQFITILLDACLEVEAACGSDSLDIEFAFTKGELYLFQVRPLVTKATSPERSDLLRLTLEELHQYIRKRQKPNPGLLGTTTLFSVMTDWNPAELIGIHPTPLALSLYRELITDKIWAVQRSRYGYRDLGAHPLMYSLLGVPFIDVRVDMNSFIPATLDNNLAAKLIDYYLNLLILTPSKHDKVEFEVIHSSYYFDLREKLEPLLQLNFTVEEICQIEKSLVDLTNAVLDLEQGPLSRDLIELSNMEKCFEAIKDSELDAFDKIYWYVDICKNQGTCSFAGIARSAFIAVQLLRSLVRIGILSPQDFDRFLGSSKTVASELHLALNDVSMGKRDLDDFLKEYGHLRPGTYDIKSPRYDEAFHIYFAGYEYYESHGTEGFELSNLQERQIDDLLEQAGLQATSLELFKFCRMAIAKREEAKFRFSKIVSEILCSLQHIGKDHGFDLDQISCMDFNLFLSKYSRVGSLPLEDQMGGYLEQTRADAIIRTIVKLPVIILQPDDVYTFENYISHPIFITMKRVCGIVAPLNMDNLFEFNNLRDRIVMIASADPGYDFLFSKKIKGLITMYGGPNSHMAIRCAELGIPAIIGIGEDSYAELCRSQFVEIDCCNQKLGSIR